MFGSVFYLLADTEAATPFSILSEWEVGRDSGVNDFMSALGFRELGYILDVLAVWSAIIVILCGVIVLVVVNYPKTVSQTKTKLVHSILVVGTVAALPYLFDVIGGLIN